MVKGAGMPRVLEMHGRFNLARKIVPPFAMVASQKPEVSPGIKTTGIASAVPDLLVDLDLLFGIAPPIEVAFQDMVAGHEDFFVNQADFNIIDRTSGRETGPASDCLDHPGSECAARKVRNRFGFRGSVDGVRFFGEAPEDLGKDGGAAGVECFQRVKERVGHFCEEGGRRGAAGDVVFSYLRQDSLGVGKAGPGQVGVGDHAGDPVGQVGE